MTLSIIVPVYNVAKYLGQCVDSIVANITDGVEVILVNDGSQDECPALCDEYASCYDFITVIHKENGGLSSARNAGLDAARGEYVWFVDSDDWILPTAISDVVLSIKKHPDVDVFSSFMRKYHESRLFFEDIKSTFYGETLSGKQYLWKRLPQGASQRFIFKRSFLNKNCFRFEANLLHEDGVWGYSTLYLANLVHVLERPIYVYRLRESGSIMSSVNIKSAYDLVKGHKLLCEFMNNRVAPNDRKNYQRAIFNMLVAIFIFCKKIFESKEFSTFMENNEAYIHKECLSVLYCHPFMKIAWIMLLNPKWIIKYDTFVSWVKHLQYYLYYQWRMHKL